MLSNSEELTQFQKETAGLNDLGFIRWSLKTFPDLAFASSLGAEDQVVLDLFETILKEGPQQASQVHAFTLDTGRLPEETYALLQLNAERFHVPIHPYFPEAKQVEALISEKGPNLFYNSVEDRKACCAVRKVAPLKRALQGRRAWITGLRREQSVTRSEVQRVEWDANNGLYKLNPLADWTHDQVWAHLKEHDVPVNQLHQKGYPSIGCAPCTRAVKPGEDERAGRWWWENPENKECGLHVSNDYPQPKVRIQTWKGI